MDVKYRIRLKNERVIGPFSTEEIGELFLKGHIDGAEMCQQFPIGDWKPIQSFANLATIIQKIQEKNLRVDEPEATLPKNAKSKSDETKANHVKPKSDEVGKDATKNQTFLEFKFGKDVKIDVNYVELEKKYQAENPDMPYEDGMEKTVVIKRPGSGSPSRPSSTTEMEKTVVVKKFEPPKPVPEKKEFKESVKSVVELKAVVPEKSHEEMVNERTEFINLKEVLPTINAQLSVSEVELEKQAKIEENIEKKRLRDLQEIMIREQAIEDGEDEDEVEVIEEYSRDKKDFEPKIVIKKKKKGMSIVAILAFLGITYFFLQPEEKPKVTGPLFLEVNFPITAPNENITAANAALQEARTLYSQGSYKNRARASGFYVNSLAQRFSGSEALGETILTYAELIDNTRDRHQSANTLYKFIQIADSKLLNDASAATGTAHFYGKIGKYQTGIYTIKNYLRAGNKPNPKMLTYYLDLLQNAGELSEARKTFDVLQKIPKKPFESYYYLAQFDLADDKTAEAKTILGEGLKYFPASALLLLQYSEILLKEQAMKAFEETLLKVKNIDAEGSPEFMANYYKQMGYLAALKNKNKEASLLFKNSLALKESDELRDTLSKLDVAGDKISQSLILESKVLGLLKKAKQEYKNKNMDLAFQYAIEAVDASPDYIPAVLFQAKLNTDRGFFESAIYSLQRIIGLYQQNNQLKKMLVEVYIKSYKFEDAERMLAEMAQTKFATSPEYASLMAQFSEAKKNPVLAIKWYDRALSRDPLSDDDMFKMAKILVKNKKFPEARSRLSKALLLDPKNVNYHALYSEILYEQDGTDTAIGYLRDIISEIGEDPILISAITTAYFKSGQLKEFQAYYKKVQSMPKKDEAFYEFLAAAAKLEGRKEDYVQSSRDLLKLNPGNLRVRMELGALLYDEKRYDEAIMEFTEVKDKLVSYPRVHYELARVYLAKNDMVKAKEMAQKELDLNPNLDAAHFIVGEVFRLNKDYREAVIKYEKAISLNPKSVDALMAMGWIRLNQNYANEAIELFSRAMKEDPANPLIHKQMGDAYRAAGQRAQAKEKYEDYLKLSPVAQDKDLIESLIRNLK
ncbi:MAG: tetratricopeptide repeat protein [Rhizobacter sp.]|nr:tetratricopeptide repeat protein [Bacteriovorax sp.]